MNIGNILFSRRTFLTACTLLFVLISSCALYGNYHQVKYTGYSYRVVAKDVQNLRCKYGNIEDNYSSIPITSRDFEGGQVILLDGAIFKSLTCTWTSLDGMRRTESIDMINLLSDRTIRFNLSGLEVVPYKPLQSVPFVQVELRNRTFRLVVAANVQYFGERVDATTRKVLYREVKDILFESN